MERKGKKLAVLADGHPRRLADGRNAWRKMNDEQRAEFLVWLTEYDPYIQRFGRNVLGAQLSIPNGFSITVPKGGA